MKQIALLLLAPFIFVLTTCGVWISRPSIFHEVLFIGTAEAGFREVADVNISPEEAYELAKPHIGLTYDIRNQVRQYPADKGIFRDYLLKSGRYYYICRDNYPYKTYYAYLRHAIVVDSKTGDVTLPSQK
ncbi:hypothetical protein [Spirochaeta cellobiosiphila]|uniref:hypothetical protein n=1 Tax=Spirochaeta cellobiosiphila TaxID=504483 RepID=UPI00041E2C2F|nr:hypothetical protein [Spirochaeta cellobiosiphila]